MLIRGFRALLFGASIIFMTMSMPVESGVSQTLSGISQTANEPAEMQRFPQFDNERATAWKSVIPPHTQSTLHRHDRFRALIALTGGELKTVTADGQTTMTALEKGKAYWFAPMPGGVLHKDVNDTGQTIEVVVVEVK